MALSEEEQVSIRHHLGYLNVGEAYTFVLGTPAGVETQFIIEGAMKRVLPAAEPRMRMMLGTLDQIECQMVGDLDTLVASRIGDIEINPEEQKKLLKAYDYWVDALSNIFGVPRNPFDKRKWNPGGGSRVNVRVSG